MTEFKSALSRTFEGFVRYRKACGRWNEASYELNLKLFDRHCLVHFPNEASLTQEMVNSWCAQRDTESNNGCVSRIYVIVSLVRYLRERKLTSVEEPAIPATEKRLYIPHAFSQEELALFFMECDRYDAPNAPRKTRRNLKLTFPVFFRLLYSSGMRTTEARKLRHHDVNLETGVVSIVNTKGYEQHYVVLHDSMLALMRRYDSAIEELYPNREYFFPNEVSGYHSRDWVRRHFSNLWKKVSTSQANAYELRHHYATENINRIIAGGLDGENHLFFLSKSMGHRSVDITAQYYYRLVPSVSDILREKTEAGFNELVPEVIYEES